MLRRAIVIVGLGHGDEGKGTIVDWLTRELGASLVVRFNGGGQAAHHVTTPDGRTHCFQMFGAGTLAGADTHLTEHVLVNPLILAVEAGQLAGLDPDLAARGPLSLVSAHRAAPLTTPFHVAVNRIRELAAGAGRHGSCGLGIGETMRDVLAGRALHLGEIGAPGWRHRLADAQTRALDHSRARLAGVRLDEAGRARADQELRVLRDRRELRDTIETFELIARAITITDRLPDAGVVVWEGAQGALLDENWGYAPHHTWSTTTSANARELLAVQPATDTTVLGVLRAFATRHGRGPLPTEIGDPTTRAALLAGEHNATNTWQEGFRTGWPDAVATRYAAIADGHLDGLVVTCTDRVQHTPMRIATGYRGATLDSRPASQTANRARTRTLMRAEIEYEPIDPDEIPSRLAAVAGVPLIATSDRADAGGKRWTAPLAVTRRFPGARAARGGEALGERSLAHALRISERRQGGLRIG
jgi:adenylosuccinate synthase